MNIELLERELWASFSQYTTEMIVTKKGRCLFPVPTFRVTGLNENTVYSISMHFEMASKYRWRYADETWEENTMREFKEQHDSTEAIAHDSPMTGLDWMLNKVSFKNAKVTNCPQKASHPLAPNKMIMLHSMHKYYIVVTVRNQATGAVLLEKGFPETNFIAVTVYQNLNIRKLKTSNNPHAHLCSIDAVTTSSKKRRGGSGSHHGSANNDSSEEPEADLFEGDDEDDDDKPCSKAKRLHRVGSNKQIKTVTYEPLQPPFSHSRPAPLAKMPMVGPWLFNSNNEDELHPPPLPYNQDSFCLPLHLRADVSSNISAHIYNQPPTTNCTAEADSCWPSSTNGLSSDDQPASKVSAMLPSISAFQLHDLQLPSEDNALLASNSFYEVLKHCQSSKSAMFRSQSFAAVPAPRLLNRSSSSNNKSPTTLLRSGSRPALTSSASSFNVTDMHRAILQEGDRAEPAAADERMPISLSQVSLSQYVPGMSSFPAVDHLLQSSLPRICLDGTGDSDRSASVSTATPQQQRVSLSPYALTSDMIDIHPSVWLDQQGMRISLIQACLWTRFMNDLDCQCLEMIIRSDVGTPMYPAPKFALEGVDPHKRYSVSLVLKPVSNKTWNLIGHNWCQATTEDNEVVTVTTSHPYGVQEGEFWNRFSFAFDHVRLSSAPIPEPPVVNSFVNPPELATVNLVLRPFIRYQIYVAVSEYNEETRVLHPLPLMFIRYASFMAVPDHIQNRLIHPLYMKSVRAM